MNYKWHIAGGIILGLIAALALHVIEWYFIPLIIFYALLPDIDHKNSTITWLLFAFAIILLGIGVLFASFAPEILKNATLYAFILLFTLFVSVLVFKHRGFTHSITFGTLMSIPVMFLFNWQTSVIVFIAFYSHLLLDGLFFKMK